MNQFDARREVIRGASRNLKVANNKTLPKREREPLAALLEAAAREAPREARKASRETL